MPEFDQVLLAIVCALYSEYHIATASSITTPEMAPRAPPSFASELGPGDEEELELCGLMQAAVDADVVFEGGDCTVTVTGCKIVEVGLELEVCGLLLAAAKGGDLTVTVTGCKIVEVWLELEV